MFTFFKMTKNDETTTSLQAKIEQATPILSVEKGSKLEKQLEIIGLDEQDLAIIQVLQEYVEPAINDIMTDFYDALRHSPKLVNIIDNNSSVERLKKTLRVHIAEMFSGVIDDEYIQKRIRIANTHVNIGLSQKWYIASFQVILNNLIAIIQKNFRSYNEQGKAIMAVTKLLNFEQQLVLTAYDEQIEKLRDKAQEKLRGSIGITVQELAKLSEETSSSIHEITTQLEEVALQSRNGTAMTEQAEQTAEEGKLELDNLQDAFNNVQKSMKNITQNIASLEKTANEIGNIVEIVKSVADQTNLLALNASIEAARAGEHGRGFAVVADEVRKLAEQTSQSVTHVSELINETNEQIHHNAVAVEEIERYIQEGGEKMNDTEAVFENIVKAMNDARQINVEMQSDLEGMNDIIIEISQSAKAVSASAEQLSQATEKVEQ